MGFKTKSMNQKKLNVLQRLLILRGFVIASNPFHIVHTNVFWFCLENLPYQVYRNAANNVSIAYSIYSRNKLFS